MHTPRVHVAAIVLWILACASTTAFPAAAGVVVSGTVSGSDQGFLTGASVAIDGAVKRTVKSDADGRFTFSDVPTGEYRILVSADGYLPLDRPLDVHNASVSIDVVLLRIPSVP